MAIRPCANRMYPRTKNATPSSRWTRRRCAVSTDPIRVPYPKTAGIVPRPSAASTRDRSARNRWRTRRGTPGTGLDTGRGRESFRVRRFLFTSAWTRPDSRRVTYPMPGIGTSVPTPFSTYLAPTRTTRPPMTIPTIPRTISAPAATCPLATKTRPPRTPNSPPESHNWPSDPR